MTMEGKFPSRSTQSDLSLRITGIYFEQFKNIRFFSRTVDEEAGSADHKSKAAQVGEPFGIVGAAVVNIILPIAGRSDGEVGYHPQEQQDGAKQRPNGSSPWPTRTRRRC